MGSNWPVVRLGSNCLKIGSGATPKGGSNVYSDNGTVWLIRSQNVYNDGFSPSGLVYISDDAAEKLKNVIVQENDILLNITGDSVARVCLAETCYLPARVNQHVAIIRPNPKDFDARYLRYVLASPRNQQILLTLASAGATRNALTKSMIEDFEVSKPPLSIQKEIADILESFSKKITLNHQINQTLEQMTQALFKSWFVDFDPVVDNALDAGFFEQGLVLPDELLRRAEARKTVRAQEGFKPLPAATRQLFPAAFEPCDEPSLSLGGWVPKGWVLTNLGQVSLCFDSKRIPLSKQQREQKKPGKYPYHGATSIMDYISEYIFDGVYLLIGEDGSVMKDDGTPFIQYIWGKTWVNNHAHVLQGKGSVTTEHLMNFMSQVDIKPYITGAVQMKINQRNLNSIPFLLPTDDINFHFSEVINLYYSKYRKNQDQISTLENIRDTLLPKLISGELSLDDVELTTQ